MSNIDGGTCTKIHYKIDFAFVKKNVLIVIYEQQHLRSFIYSGALDQLHHRSNLQIVYFGEAPFDLTNISVVQSLPTKLKKLGTLMAHSQLWKLRSRSTPHLVRANASLSGRNLRRRSKSMISYGNEDWSELKRLMVRLLAKWPAFEIITIVRRWFVRPQIKNTLLAGSLSNKPPSLVLIPYSGKINSNFDDLVDFFNYIQVPTMALQENWDNLCSKTFIRAEPKFFAVWGQQSLRHLREIQRLRLTCPLVVGSPRFRPYFDAELMKGLWAEASRKLGLNQVPYVLLTGTGDGTSDSLLISKSLSVLSSDNCPVRTLVYRPHPYSRNPISQNELRNLMDKHYLVVDFASRFESASHCALVKNAEVVINQFSTITLESIITNTKCLVPAFDTKTVNYSFLRAIKEYPHYENIFEFSNIFLCSKSFEFENALAQAIKVKRPPQTKSFDDFCNPGVFSENLWNQVNTILNHNKKV